MKKVKWCSSRVEIPGVSLRDYERETAFQIYCMTWLRKQFELTGDERFERWHHSANERYGAKAGHTAKMMGQSKGFPDFIHCGARIAIELKVPGGVPSIEQVRWIEYFKGIGWKAEVIYSFERFCEVVQSE